MDSIFIKNKPVLLKNTDFQSIMIKVFFPFQETDQDLAKSVLLPSLLASISEHFPTEEEFHKEKKRNYILGVNISRTVVGTTGAFIFTFIIPDVYSLGKDELEKQFAFFQEVLYHPVIENHGFLEKEVNREITNLRSAMDNAKKNLRPYQSIRIRELIDDEGILSRDLIHTPEEIDKLTSQNMYDYYQKIILKNQPAIYVMGNIEEDRINALCEKYHIHHFLI